MRILKPLFILLTFWAVVHVGGIELTEEELMPLLEKMTEESFERADLAPEVRDSILREVVRRFTNPDEYFTEQLKIVEEYAPDLAYDGLSNNWKYLENSEILVALISGLGKFYGLEDSVLKVAATDIEKLKNVVPNESIEILSSKMKILSRKLAAHVGAVDKLFEIYEKLTLNTIELNNIEERRVFKSGQDEVEKKVGLFSECLSRLKEEEKQEMRSALLNTIVLIKSASGTITKMDETNVDFSQEIVQSITDTFSWEVIANITNNITTEADACAETLGAEL